MSKKPARRKCANKACRQWFEPARSEQTVCSYACACEYGKAHVTKTKTREQQAEARQAKAKAKLERAEWRQRKEAVKPLKHWIDLTQRAVNDICRETELAAGKGCISCGTRHPSAWHAGHYRTTAAAGHLRFTRINIHLQCDACNTHKSGNIEAYRASLVAFYGESAVQELENNNTPHRWTPEELKSIRLQALADLRALKRKVAA